MSEIIFFLFSFVLLILIILGIHYPVAYCASLPQETSSKELASLIWIHIYPACLEEFDDLVI
jgi:hypothetical protein